MFDSMRLHAELDHIRHTLGNLAATAGGKTMVDELRGGGGATTAALLWQALYADCMRIVYGAVAADGVISDDEIAGLYDMLAAAARCYAAVDPEAYGEFIVVDRRGARAFLERYATDRAPCGRGSPVLWPGLALCRRAAELGNTAALERYERAATWLMVEACRIGGITDEDPRWRGRVHELDGLRSSLAHDAVVVVPAVDLRVQAFLAATGIFTAVQPAHAIFESDPFDVESIHRQARDSFHQMVEAARTSSPIGQMLLVLGDSGSGKTHLLRGFRHHVQEYGRGFVALERDVAVILVDRRGDLAGYAKADWWQRAAEPERARLLAERLDVRLFTPGLRDGRPLALPVVPDLVHIPEQERDRIVQGAASALAAMMRFGDGAADTARLAILTQAISVLAARSSSSGLAELVALVARQDDALVARAARAGHYDDAVFQRLAQDLEAIQLSDAPLFDPAAESLTMETLTGRHTDGKVPLAIVSTRFLGDVPRIQSWVAHLIGCLSSHLTEQSGNRLHTVLVIDEADLFLPAGTARTASKAPLQDLLRRAQTAGLAVVLASQSPADFDYRSRDLISTWFLGRIPDTESVDRMKPLLERLPPIRSKLGRLELGRFVMLQERGVLDLERAPSLMRTELLSEDELIALAAQANPRGHAGAQLPA